MSIEERFQVDKTDIRRAFDRAAPHYDEAAVLQAEVRERMLERLDYVKLTPGRVLDVGAGTGHGALALRRRYPGAEVVAMDLSPGMVAEARSRRPLWRRPLYACGDIGRLPLRDGCVDLVFSNLTLQWCADPEVVFAEINRVLKPGGLLLFSSLGPDTLHELRASWAAADPEGQHVNAFMDMHDVGDALVRAQMADPVMDVEHITMTYADVKGVMRDLKSIGAHNMQKGRRKGMTGKQRFTRMVEAYESRREAGVLPATYEVVYGHAWGSGRVLPQQRQGDEVRVPLSVLTKR